MTREWAALMRPALCAAHTMGKSSTRTVAAAMRRSIVRSLTC